MAWAPVRARALAHTVARALPPPVAGALRLCALGWLWLAGLWWASRSLLYLPAWGWLLVLTGLAAAPGWGAWLSFMVRKRVLRAQFAPQRALGRWLSGGGWAAGKAWLLSWLLCTAALWQGYFLAPWEWALLALAPPLHAAVAQGVQAWLGGQFAQPAYAWGFGHRVARAVVLLALGGAWLGWMAHSGLAGRDLVPATPPEALDAALAAIEGARSGLVRWGLDALLAVQVGSGAALALPDAPVLRLVLLALVGPGGLLLCVGWALQGVAGGRPLWRAVRPPLRSAPGVRAAVVALVAVLLASVALHATATLEALVRAKPSPLALQRLPACERIGQRYYTLGTLEALRRVALQALGEAARPQACVGAAAARQALDAAVERYLDWYFSLGAEWGRMAHLLSGDAENFLRERLARTLAEAPGLQGWLQGMEQQALRQRAALATGQRRIDEVLERHHLALDAGRCLVRAQATHVPQAVQVLGNARQRLATSAVTGAGVGAFAAAVAGKAVAKTSMKAAAKVLAKAAAKQAFAKAGSAGAGALAGAAIGSVVPGAGTALGAAVGAVAGLGTGLAIDWSLLRAEEHLTREGMREELHEVLGAQLRLLTQALSCVPDPARAD